MIRVGKNNRGQQVGTVVPLDEPFAITIRGSDIPCARLSQTLVDNRIDARSDPGIDKRRELRVFIVCGAWNDLR